LKWNENNFEDELFPSEKEALEIVKQSQVAKFFHDRFIMACLFSRKMDIERTIKMLKNHLKWRMNNGYGKIPKWEEVDKAFLEANIGMMIPGTRCKEGNSIIYCKMGRLIPSDFGKNYIKTIVDYVIWNYSVGTFLNGLDFHRNGLIVITDLQGLGWKNIDFGLQKKVNSALMDNFPLRIQKVILLNPPSIVPALISCFRIFIKKKIMDRIEISTVEDLENFIDKDNLWQDFGGNVEYTVQDLIDSITSYNPSKKLRVRSVSKKGDTKKNSKSKDKDKDKLKKSEKVIDNDLLKSSRKSSRLRKKEKQHKQETAKTLLDNVNVDDIPPEQYEALKLHHTQDSKEDSTEEGEGESTDEFSKSGKKSSRGSSTDDNNTEPNKKSSRGSSNDDNNTEPKTKKSKKDSNHNGTKHTEESNHNGTKEDSN